MKAFKEFITEDLSKSDLDAVERMADKLFAKVGIDVEFTRHFLDRVNDARNKKPISSGELVRIFKLTYKKHGSKISKLGKNAEAIMHDINSHVNIPFVLKWDEKNQEFDMISKTVMRKKDFKSNDPKLEV
jgi:hypothetical protein